MSVLRKIVTQFVFQGNTKSVDALEKKVNKLVSGFKNTEKPIEKAEKNVNNFNKTLKKSLVRIGVFLGVRGLLGMAKNFSRMAENAIETEGKFDVVFSKMSEKADQFSKNLIKNYDLGVTESKRLLSSTGDLLTGFGFTQEEALNLSNQVQELAVDLASFSNVEGGSARASEAITKALLGEREMLKSLGRTVSETAVKREAANRGITGQLTRQQKARITLDLIIKQSANAIGDYAKTSGSAANRTKALITRTNDLKVSIGKALIPIRSFIVNGLLVLVKQIPLVKKLLVSLGVGFIALTAIFVAFGNAAVISMLKAVAIPIFMVAAIAAASVAIGLIITDIIGYFQGKDSVTGRIFKAFKEMWPKIKATMLEWVKSIPGIFNNLLEYFQTFRSNLKKDIITVFDFISDYIWESISGPFKKIPNLLKNAKEEIKSWFSKDKSEEDENKDLDIIKKEGDSKEKKKITEDQVRDLLKNLSSGTLKKDISINKDSNYLAPKNVSNSSNSSVTNNNNPIIKSPIININVKESDDRNSITKSVTSGIQNGLQGVLNQSLRPLTN